MLFIDASVIVAILADDEDRDQLLDRLAQEEGPFYVSSVVRMEASFALTRRRAEAVGRDKPATADMLQESRHVVDQFLVDLEAKEIMISGDVGSKALDAAQQFGKIVNHPAKLNMGDCFSYACARAYRTKVAYKGNDFSLTDIGW
ncbi:MAG: type II toxin-antitoxin system VapC family toxin [Alphaproteobacteria bacterium]|nr:type II toxin-antitoxin system VapC family toxin [Alphaproteobacteria bacterium]MBU1551506.1 type II toxin-antitoxin system VapC family toxin [Alphaproteobacteria bacterium]MBU2334658.1 type II toxin-antitoxin system VapC family toxin [Alphaproteobacteria bacterium]MBU2386380.1 type II toxin-antitoxin system VapC family toxin [Alphaproteobacteria bacterium]